MKASIILNTYNRPDALGLVLEGYRRQTEKDFEIVIADDGSGPETAALVREYAEKAPFPVRHVWHEDTGHRRTVILNKAVEAAASEYLILSDGDCIPRDDFVAVHLENRRDGAFVNGRRLLLSQAESEALTLAGVQAGRHLELELPDAWKELKKWDRRFRFYQLIGRRDRLRLMAANFAIAKVDYVRVNGFDERYLGWGAADDDLQRRLLRAGLKWRNVVLKALVYHLAHPPVPSKPKRVKEGRNRAYHDRGFYLTRPMEGMEKRTLADLQWAIHYDLAGAEFDGDWLRGFREALAAGTAGGAGGEGPTGTVEVSLTVGVAGPKRFRRASRGEVNVLLLLPPAAGEGAPGAEAPAAAGKGFEVVAGWIEGAEGEYRARVEPPAGEKGPGAGRAYAEACLAALAALRL